MRLPSWMRPTWRTFVGRLHRFEHRPRREAERGQALLPQANRQLRRARGRLDLDVERALHRGDRVGDRAGIVVEQVEIGSVEIHDHLRGKPGDGFLDALGEKAVHGERHAGPRATRAAEDVADLAQDARLFGAVERADLDLELAVVRTEGVRTVLRSPDPFGHRLDALHAEQRLGSPACRCAAFPPPKCRARPSCG